jgi:enoyl-CoA hydratase
LDHSFGKHISMSTDSTSDLQVDTHGHTLQITFNRPQARNALTFAMYQGMADAIRSLTQRPEIRAVLICGAGEKAFASGTDISQFQAFTSAQDAIDYEHRISNILDTLEHCPVPTVAAVSGACTGGGFGIAACCDIRLATQDARFGFPMARTLGNCLSLSTHARLASLLGEARVKDLVLSARLISAHEFLGNGFVSEVLTNHAELMTKSLALTEQIAQQAPLTMRVTKQSMLALRPPIDLEKEQALFLQAYLSKDFQEGVSAFLEKRAAQWSGT